MGFTGSVRGQAGSVPLGDAAGAECLSRAAVPGARAVPGCRKPIPPHVAGQLCCTVVLGTHATPRYWAPVSWCWATLPRDCARRPCPNHSVAAWCCQLPPRVSWLAPPGWQISQLGPLYKAHRTIKRTSGFGPKF